MSLVSFITTAFSEVCVQKENTTVKFGFRLQDSYNCTFCDNLSWKEVQALTPQDALNMMKDKAAEFYRIVVEDKGGFDFNGSWVEVSEKGIVI